MTSWRATGAASTTSSTRTAPPSARHSWRAGCRPRAEARHRLHAARAAAPKHRRAPLADDPCRATGLSGVKLHDLRHFYASGLIAAGCDVVTVQGALGHASATTTLNTYSHLWPTAEDRTRRAAEDLFADSCGLGADSTASTRL